uniref:Uncharacterized protein n=1 Tax=Salix viminalis TaxID=40686 RepID=A0A6N2MVE4_SALVM
MEETTYKVVALALAVMRKTVETLQSFDHQGGWLEIFAWRERIRSGDGDKAVDRCLGLQLSKALSDDGPYQNTGP